MKHFRWYDFVFLLLLSYLFILQIQAIWPFTIDDMYISLRYARHLAAGNGLLWNLQSPPVEGYSNFSFVILGALSLFFNINPVISLKVAGIIGLFFTCLFSFLISRYWFDKRQALIPCIWLLLYKGQIIWTASGLETTVFQALICGAVFFAFKGMGYMPFPNIRELAKPGASIMSGLLLSLAGMTRPEAPVFMIMFLILMFWDKPQLKVTNYRRSIEYFVLTLMIVFLPYFIWRWDYFGFIFPNPIYCKGLSTDEFLSLDLSYIKLIWPFALFALPACIKASDRRHYFLWLPSILYLLMLADADSVVGFYNRFFLPAFALLLPLALLGINNVLLWYLKDRDSIYFMTFYSTALFVTILFIPGMTLSQYQYFTENPQKGEQLRKRVIDWLKVHATSNSTVVLGDSGMIPFYTNFKFIDSYCLNNSIMAHYPVHERYERFCKQIVLERPQIFILTSLIDNGKIIYTPSDLCLKKILNKQSGYKLTETMYSQKSNSSYRYELFTNF